MTCALWLGLAAALLAALVVWRPLWRAPGASQVPFAATGTVAAVIDGDSLEIDTAERGRLGVRLHAIDAPELLQPFGWQARRALSQLVDGRCVRIDCYKTDPRGRKVCRVLVEGQDVGVALVQQGMAWHFREFAAEQGAAERRVLHAAEQQARAARRGLWAAASPLAPWDCRARLRRLQVCD